MLQDLLTPLRASQLSVERRYISKAEDPLVAERHQACEPTKEGPAEHAYRFLRRPPSILGKQRRALVSTLKRQQGQTDNERDRSQPAVILASGGCNSCVAGVGERKHIAHKRGEEIGDDGTGRSDCLSVFHCRYHDESNGRSECKASFNNAPNVQLAMRKLEHANELGHGCCCWYRG
ncbi:hypothetical protein ACCO45_013593 [Purpureocillium lilacinum]|uniref:Uncharacterized protein n=1 Tax=Purpureocillium lilacinum TaxID=33203 RepID=A0ACC4D6N6_PURLI